MNEVDLLVVGAGSSGASLAARVSEDPSRRVLLLEAGPDYRSDDTPAAVRDVWPLHTFHDPLLRARHLWDGLNATRSARQEPWPYLQGRGVGGSSAINGLFAVRPIPEDLDEWAADGCTGWAFDDVLPILKRMEADVDFGTVSYHGADGPLPITRPATEDLNSFEAAFVAAGQGIGHRWEPDHNAPGSAGLSPYAYNARNGRRVSTNDAYLEPARQRPNLRVLGDTQVTELLFGGDRVAGVKALRHGEHLEFRAAHVVLAAGVFHSPAILLRSGIGPAHHLRNLSIGVRRDLPVGLGLQDHPAISIEVAFTDEAPTQARGRRHSRVCLRFDADGADRNDIMIAAMNPLAPGDRGQLVGWANKAGSRGQVTLQSTDPLTPPRIQQDLLSRDEDVRRLRRVLRECRDLLAQPEMGAVAGHARMVADPRTGATTSIPSAAEPRVAELLLHAVHDVQHATSTCRMGAADDGTTVVDPSGRVWGLDGLRVADASVLPSVPRANTHLSSVLVGEKIAADLLRENR